MRIYYDSLQEGMWFRDLHNSLTNVPLEPFPSINAPPLIAAALIYDRPDVILANDQLEPILILERTVEVPSGHNVGQRFARLVGAAKLRVPAVYFGPFKAMKHGGITRGPRYMNMRLFHAVDEMVRIEDTAITIINWPVDSRCEILQTPQRDIHIREYLDLFFRHYSVQGSNGIVNYLMQSNFEVERRHERQLFARNEIRNPNQYDIPPPSVEIVPTTILRARYNIDHSSLKFPETVLYNVGMTYVRSDPYTGSAMLYSYLYCGGIPTSTRNLILQFPIISIAMWRAVGNTGKRKDERLFRMVADGIQFSDGYVQKAQL
jgi:hypothetical protein